MNLSPKRVVAGRLPKHQSPALELREIGDAGILACEDDRFPAAAFLDQSTKLRRGALSEYICRGGHPLELNLATAEVGERVTFKFVKIQVNQNGCVQKAFEPGFQLMQKRRVLLRLSE